MDWNALLDQRLADSPQALRHYRLAVAMEGAPLPSGRRLYAIADVLGVDADDIMADLRVRIADEQQVTAYLEGLEKRIALACASTPR